MSRVAARADVIDVTPGKEQQLHYCYYIMRVFREPGAQSPHTTCLRLELLLSVGSTPLRPFALTCPPAQQIAAASVQHAPARPVARRCPSRSGRLA